MPTLAARTRPPAPSAASRSTSRPPAAASTARAAAGSRRAGVAANVYEPVGTAHGTYPAPARTDDQVTFVIADLRVYVGALYRLGRECRPQLAWRCQSLGTAIDAALKRHFPEIPE